jgi:hypothetical protein
MSSSTGIKTKNGCVRPAGTALFGELTHLLLD